MQENTFWLTGFSLDPDTAEADFYTLFLPGDKDEPLHEESYIIFFNKPELASVAISLCSNNTEGFGTPPQTMEEMEAMCEIAITLYYVAYEDIDPDASIIFCLNTLFDLVRVTKIVPPSEYKSNLYAFADHMTFSRDISIFFEEHDISRDDIVNAIIWFIGAITFKSKFITS